MATLWPRQTDLSSAIASGAASYCIKFTSIRGRNAETTTSNLYQADAKHRNASAGSLNCNLAPKARACELSRCENFCAFFLPGHVNTWPPCQANACAIYPNHALLNVKISNSIDAQIAAQNLPGLGGQTFPLIDFDNFPASLSLACLLVKQKGEKNPQQGSFRRSRRICQQPLAAIGPTYRHVLSRTYEMTAPSRMMKEQGASRACKDDWAQIVGNDLLPET